MRGRAAGVRGRSVRNGWIAAFVALLMPVALALGCEPGQREADSGSRGSRGAAESQGAVENQGARDSRVPERPAADEAAGTLSCEGLEREILRTETTRAAMAAAYGPPDSVDADTEPNRHIPEATDSLFVVQYPGMVVQIRRPPSGDDLTSHVSILDNRYLSEPSVGIGAPADRVMSVLGEPGSRGEDRLVYDCGPHTEQPVTFWLADGTVERIEISYYVD